MKITSSQRETYRTDSTATLIKSGQEYFVTLEKLIDEAKVEIQFQTYIFDYDDTGKRITEALIRAAQRGVKVFLMVDSFGSMSLGNEFIQLMKDRNIFFRKFSPFFSKEGFHIGRRLHHKVVVSDEQKALVGGINIADKYHGTEKETAWFDFAVLVEGKICRHLAMICQRIEQKKFTIRKKDKQELAKVHPFSSNQLIRIRQNDWARSKKQIRTGYKTAIRNAEHSITIVAAYFLPGVTLRKTLRKASKRGVKIKLLLSENSDVPFIKSAHRFLYGWLLHLNVQVFEYRPSVMHGKAMLVDDEWATIGSYNLNHLSAYSSVELNIDVYCPEFGLQFRKHLEDVFANDCKEVTYQTVSRKNVFLKMKDWFSYQMIRINMSLLFLFIRKGEKNRLE